MPSPDPRSDLELVQAALRLAEGPVAEILAELERRCLPGVGQRKYQTAWANGRVARSEGISRDACPYVDLRTSNGGCTFVGIMRRYWLQGWDGKDKGYRRERSLAREAVSKLLVRAPRPVRRSVSVG